MARLPRRSGLRGLNLRVIMAIIGVALLWWSLMSVSDGYTPIRGNKGKVLVSYSYFEKDDIQVSVLHRTECFKMFTHGIEVPRCYPAMRSEALTPFPLQDPQLRLLHHDCHGRRQRAR